MYGGLGAVVASQLQNSGRAYWNLEEFRTNQIGSVIYQHTRYAAQSPKSPSWSFYTPDGLLTARSGTFPYGCPPGTAYVDTLYQIADAAGNVIRSGEEVVDNCSAQHSQNASNLYYATDNHLMFVEKKTDVSSTWEEYWYDALGRRVMTRTRHDMAYCMQTPSMSCPGFVERTLWDGDQLIGEERTSGLDQVMGGAPYYGTVRYVHLVGMDAPVAILDSRFSDARVIHYNWRGLAEASSFTDGSPADCELGQGGFCTRIAWNAGEGVYFKRSTDPYAGMTPVWIGSLPANGKGDAGLLYRRNRFFDPASGRFTQQDPIGIGGGLNLYGFAGGDPVTFTDPFGLCPPIETCKLVSGTFGLGWKGVGFQVNAAVVSGKAHMFGGGGSVTHTVFADHSETSGKASLDIATFEGAAFGVAGVKAKVGCSGETGTGVDCEAEAGGKVGSLEGSCSASIRNGAGCEHELPGSSRDASSSLGATTSGAVGVTLRLGIVEIGADFHVIDTIKAAGMTLSGLWRSAQGWYSNHVNVPDK